MHSRILWQTQLMSVVLLQNSSTNFFQGSEIFMCLRETPGCWFLCCFWFLHRQQLFWRSSFLYKNLCSSLLLSNSWVNNISLSKFRGFSVWSRPQMHMNLFFPALGFEQIFLVKQRIPSSQDYPQQHGGDQKRSLWTLLVYHSLILLQRQAIL